LSETESAYIAHLEAVRSAHVNERRRMAQSAIDSSKANKVPVTASWGKDIQHQQEMIEAIDRAIADEKKLGRGPTTVAVIG
jgi:hypothetical protein